MCKDHTCLGRTVRGAIFSRGVNGDGGRRHAGDELPEAASPATAESRLGASTAVTAAAQRGGAMSSVARRVRTGVDGPAGGRLSPGATCWSRARRSSPSGRTCKPAAPRMIDARGRIVMPGFIDTHHHQFETALRSFLADGILINDGSGLAERDHHLLRIHPAEVRARVPAGGRVHQRAVRRPEPARRRRHDGARHLADPSLARSTPDAAIQALFDTRTPRRLRLFRERGRRRPGNQYPQDAVRIKQQWFSSSDQLVHMIMGGEVYLGEPTYTQSWTIGRQLGLQIAAHILSPFGIRPILDDARPGHGRRQQRHRARTRQPVHPHDRDVRPGLAGRQGRRRAGLASPFPIEMNMRHGMPPILKMQSLGMEPSLSSDVEVTMTADFFTQMRSAMTMQRMVVNQMILEQGTFASSQPVADAGPRHAAAAQCARRAALRHDQRREAPEAGRQDRLAHAGQGGGHHPARRHGASTWRRSTTCRERSYR